MPHCNSLYAIANSLAKANILECRFYGYSFPDYLNEINYVIRILCPLLFLAKVFVPSTVIVNSKPLNSVE